MTQLATFKSPLTKKQTDTIKIRLACRFVHTEQKENLKKETNSKQKLFYLPLRPIFINFLQTTQQKEERKKSLQKKNFPPKKK